MASDAAFVMTAAAVVLAGLGVGLAVASASRWARDSRQGERLAGSPFTSSLGGLLLAVAGAVAALLSLAGLSPWVAGIVLASGATLAAVLSGIDRIVRWLRVAEASDEHSRRAAEPTRLSQELDERVGDER
jgi:hypothetical protein